MKAVALVSAGGILGSLARWQIIETTSSLNLGVFIVNQLGVLIAGLFAFSLKSNESKKLFWITGFAGGFTTMASLAFVLHSSQIQSAALYASISLLSSFLILKMTKAVLAR